MFNFATKVDLKGKQISVTLSDVNALETPYFWHFCRQNGYKIFSKQINKADFKFSEFSLK